MEAPRSEKQDIDCVNVAVEATGVFRAHKRKASEVFRVGYRSGNTRFLGHVTREERLAPRFLGDPHREIGGGRGAGCAARGVGVIGRQARAPGQSSAGRVHFTSTSMTKDQCSKCFNACGNKHCAQLFVAIQWIETGTVSVSYTAVQKCVAQGRYRR